MNHFSMVALLEMQRRITHLDRITLVIPRRLRAQILSEAQEHQAVETGFTMFGYNRAPIFIVTDCLTGPNAKRSSSSFAPDIQNDQRILDEIRRRDPEITFLGFAHTHRHDLTPSGRDIKSLDAALQVCGFIILVIVGETQKENPPSFRGFLRVRNFLDLFEIDVLEDETYDSNRSNFTGGH